MTELTNLVERAVLEAYDFSGCGTIVDVGGGHGGLIASILKKHANLKGVVYDSPQVEPTRQSVNTAKKTNDASLRESEPVC